MPVAGSERYFYALLNNEEEKKKTSMQNLISKRGKSIHAERKRKPFSA